MSVDEEKNLGDEVEAGKTERGLQDTPREAFRRSAGFQIRFVLHSGLEIGRAIDHLCASAEKFCAAMREWQPIETAPKGKDSLLYRANGMFVIADWGRYEKYNGGQFTHWLPLPEPPNAVESAQRPISGHPAHGPAS